MFLLVFVRKFVGEAMSVIAAKASSPVTVKCRIGVDDHDSYDELCESLFPLSPPEVKYVC